MKNLSGKLHGLFHSYLNRKSREFTSSVYTPYSSDIFYGVIYFYEWSNVSNPPRKFFTIDMFDRFLKESGIYMTLYEKDIIKKLKWSYITCKKGKREIIIRDSWQSLNNALNLHEQLAEEEKMHSIGFTASQPSSESLEPSGRWFG